MAGPSDKAREQLASIKVEPSFQETIYPEQIEESIRNSRELLHHAHTQLALTRPHYPGRERSKITPANPIFAGPPRAWQDLQVVETASHPRDWKHAMSDRAGACEPFHFVPASRDRRPHSPPRQCGCRHSSKASNVTVPLLHFEQNQSVQVFLRRSGTLPFVVW
jgi:hypothetical protein